ncbi:MAG TPA: transcription termination/antitermination NusG family protein [Candidatus Angelobacter sp.]
MCSLNNLDRRWLCLQVKSGGEFRSALGLKERGYETFVPVFEQKREWSDRIKIVQVPLFIGYVFLRFNVGNTHSVVTAPGVLRFVGTGKMPMPIEDSEIEALQVTTQAGLLCGPCAFLEVGQEVEVRLGPLISLRGKIVRFKNKQRLILSVNLIKRSVFVEVDGYEVVPVTAGFSQSNLGMRCSGDANPATASIA